MPKHMHLQVHCRMKRSSWKENISTSSEHSSDSDSDSVDDNLDSKHSTGSKYIIDTKTKANNKKKKLGVMDYEALSKHGYNGGPSVLKIPPPRVEEKEQNWSWSTGKEGDERKKDSNADQEESYAAREQTRAAAHGEELRLVHENLQSDKRDKKASFSQKEKRKRDLGQASRGKSYVEEEKRLLRDSGVYSGFDS